MIHSFSHSNPLEEKCRVIETLLAPHARVALAYSGGVDSSFLAWLLVHVMKKDLRVFLARTSLLSRREHDHALRVVKEIGLPLEEVVLEPLNISEVRQNSPQRCTFCKRAVMQHIMERMDRHLCTILVDGTNAEDMQKVRPGKKALEELGVLSPLAAAGLLKSEIRSLSRQAGLSTWDKPSQSCLATRVSYHTQLTRELLSRIEEAEILLWDLGCRQVRVRVHGELARIEVFPDDFALLLNSDSRENLIKRFHSLGFAHVCLDLTGFESGSWDIRETSVSIERIGPK